MAPSSMAGAPSYFRCRSSILENLPPMCPGSMAIMSPSSGSFREGRSSSRVFQFQTEPGDGVSDKAKRRTKGSSDVFNVASVSVTVIHFFQPSVLV